MAFPLTGVEIISLVLKICRCDFYRPGFERLHVSASGYALCTPADLCMFRKNPNTCVLCMTRFCLPGGAK